MRKALAALLFALLPSAVLSQAPADEAKATVAALERALEQRPNDATLWFYLARFQSQLGDRAAVVRALEKVLELGDGYLPPRADFAAVWDDAAFQAVRGKLEAKLPRLDYAPTAYELEDRGLIPEGIGYDAPSHSVFIGSIAQRKVVRIEEDGRVADFTSPAAELDAILGVTVDSPRRALYMVSTSALTTEGEKKPRNAVVAYDIDSRRRLQRYEVPQARQLNDVAVGFGGRVFTSDSATGAVYEIPVKGPGPAREVLAPGQVRGSNGLAVSPDGRRLYIAHNTGLVVLDIASGGVKRVENRTRESIAAIDGLAMQGGDLVGVQNVTNPGRVIRMRLDAAGDTVVEVKTLLSHHHNALFDPTTLAVTERGILLLAATGVTRYKRDGRIEDPATVPKPAIVRIP